MRIIAGKWRGRPLLAPEGLATRPTSARAREALFSMLASRIGSFADMQVLDLFAGTGALGLEALSRGAAHALFIERDAAAVRLLQQNIARLGADADVLQRDATRPAVAPRRFDLVFLDAPYDSGASAPTLHALTTGDWLAPDAWLAVETSRAEVLEHGDLTTVAEKAYGKAKITLLRAPG